jgi:enamine deaminase RidA (YjgF/YER057c/UK114 family)
MTIQRLDTARVPKPLAHASHGARVDDLIFLSGQLASDSETGVPEGVGRRTGYPYYGSDMRDQTRYILRNIKATLEDAGSDLEHVVKAQVFLLDCAHFDEFDRVWEEFFTTPPPRSTVAVGERGLEVPGALVEVDVIAVRRGAVNQPEALSSSRIPKPIAHYTPAVRIGDLVFLAGQLPSHFGDGGIAPEARPNPAYPYHSSAIELQTEYVLKNVKLLLEDAGSDLQHVVKAQVFLKSLSDFSGFDEIWKRFFPVPPPRTTIQVSDLLVGDALVEIDIIGARTDAGRLEVVRTDAVPQPLANYSMGVVAGNLVFLAGQFASDFKTGVPPEARVDPRFPFYGDDIERQTEYVLTNIEAVLTSAGSSLANVVKAQIFLTNMENFHGFDKTWARHFGAVPARTTVRVPGDGLLVPGTLVEIDVIAVRD